MSNISSIRLAIHVTTLHRDAMAKGMAQEQRSLTAATEQMQQLQAYAGDTDARWTRGTANTLSSELVKHHYQFMARLQHAMALQSQNLARLERQVESARLRLLQAEVRLSGLGKILKKAQLELDKRAQHREQRQTDEYAGMMHARQAIALMNGDTP